MARRPSAPERTCCDGLCQRPGGTCPAFAPGVLAGPYRAQRSRAAARLLLATLAAVVFLAWLGWH